jgi:hypothetical protein
MCLYLYIWSLLYLLYVNIGLFIHIYISYSMSKFVLTTCTNSFFYVRKCIFDLQQDKLNKCVNIFFTFIAKYNSQLIYLNACISLLIYDYDFFSQKTHLKSLHILFFFKEKNLSTPWQILNQISSLAS